jgi:hypothetical protein
VLELRGHCDVGSLDAVPCQSLQSKPSKFFVNSKSIAEFGRIHLVCSLYRNTVAYPIEFLCLTVCKFVVLDRMVLFMLHDVDNTEKKWIVWRRLALAVALAGNLAGLAADAAAATYYHAAATL